MIFLEVVAGLVVFLVLLPFVLEGLEWLVWAVFLGMIRVWNFLDWLDGRG